MIPHIKTPRALVFTCANGTPQQVGVDHRCYEEILELVENADPSVENYATIEELLTPLNTIKRIAESEGDYFECNDEGEITCTIEGIPFQLPTDLSLTVLELYKAAKSLDPLLNFVRKLASNPRRETINEVWSFISECGMSLTPDGNFLAYKNVNHDFTSVWDGKTENNPGTIVRMRRSDVQHNPDITCSHGLHFAAWGYLSFYAPGRKTVLLSIDPADVVSIPSDYNNMKGRACKYLVVREVEQPEELKKLALFDERIRSEHDEVEDVEVGCPVCDGVLTYDDDDTGGYCTDCGYDEDDN